MREITIHDDVAAQILDQTSADDLDDAVSQALDEWLQLDDRTALRTDAVATPEMVARPPVHHDVPESSQD